MAVPVSFMIHIVVHILVTVRFIVMEVDFMAMTVIFFVLLVIRNAKKPTHRLVITV